jgi:hypothetical protein
MDLLIAAHAMAEHGAAIVANLQKSLWLQA